MPRDRDLARSIMRATRWLEHENAVARFELTIRALHKLHLELRHWQDQPRIPAGNDGGGRWTPGGSHGANRSRVALAAKFLGRRYGLGDDRMIVHCYYRDIFGREFTRQQDALLLCPPTLPVPPYDGPI